MDRQQALLAWTQKALNDPKCYVKVASADASFRSYWRVFSKATTYIVMDAPVEHENCESFIDISSRLEATGIQVVKVLEKDLSQGFLLLNDLGTVQYLDVLTDETCNTLYTDAMDALHTIQQHTEVQNLPFYDEALLQTELDLFTEWFIDRHLDYKLNIQQKSIIKECNQLLIDNALEQPQVFVHRDYHSRNLMKTKKDNPGILDFQDAVVGAVTYDLVSLLKDCYIKWDESIVNRLSNDFRKKYNQLNNTEFSQKQWRRWFDLMGLQRHIKVAGIFCRLNYRDNKPNYLKDLNMTLCYIKTTCNKYPEFQPLLNLINKMSPTMETLCE